MTPIVQLLRHTSSGLAIPGDPGSWFLTIQVDDTVNYDYVNAVSTVDSSILIATSQSFLKINNQGQVTNAKKLIYASSINILNFNVFADDSIGYCGAIDGPNSSAKLLSGLLNNTTNMTPQWSSSWGPTTLNKITYGYAIDKNITDNTYSVVGYGNNNSSLNNAVSLKIANNGTLQAARTYAYGSNSVTSAGGVEDKITTDRYVVTNNHFIKLNSASTIVWQRSIPSPATTTPVIAFENKLYFRGNSTSGYIVNPDGSTNAAFFVVFDNFYPTFTGLAVDSTGIYLVGTTYFDSQIFLVKLNAAGDSIIYCRTIALPNSGISDFYPTVIVQGDYLYITTGAGSSSIIVIRYPKSGSLLLNTANVVVQSVTASVYDNTLLDTSTVTTASTPSNSYTTITNPTIGTPSNVITNKGVM